jgi:hypothetical protein
MFGLPLGLVILVLVIIGMLLLIHRQFCFYIFLIYAPFSYYYAYLSASAFAGGSFLQKTLRDLLICAVYLFWWLSLLAKKQYKLTVPQQVGFSIIIIIITIQILYVMPSSFHASILALRSMFEFVPLMFLVPSLFPDKIDLQRILNILFGCSLLVSVLGLYEIYIVFTSNFYLFFLGLFRIHSTLYNPNNFGAYLAVCILLLAGLFMKKKYFINQAFTIALLLMCIICLFFTFSRSSFLSVVLGTLFLFAINRRIKLVIGSILIFTLIVSSVYLFYPSIFRRYVALGDIQSGSVTGRANSINQALDLFFNEPYLIFTGVGFNQVTPIAAQTTNTATGNDRWQAFAQVPTDNFYLSLLVGGGIISFMMYLCMIFIFLLLAIRISFLTTDTFLAGLAQGIGAVFVSQMFFNATATLWNTFPGGFYYWLLVGMLISIKRLVRKAQVQ